MKFKIILLFSIIFVMLFSATEIAYRRYISEALQTDTSAFSYVLINTETGSTVIEKDSNTKYPSGALNKLMTSLLALEAIEDGTLSTDMILTASQLAHEASGAVIWLNAGEEISVLELIKALMIGNAGDAAIVLAEQISGNIESFTALMNIRAYDLGMKNTFFTSPYKMDDENQYTTAYDAAILAREITFHREAYDIMTTWTDSVRQGKTELVNENVLVKDFKGINGIKAWHTEQSGYSAVISAERNGCGYISVILGCQDKDERFTLAGKLIKNGFSSYKTVIPGFCGEYMKPLKVKGGTDYAVITDAYNISALVIPDGSEENMETVIFLPEYIKAPVKKGQKLGEVAFYLDSTLIYETPLIAVDSVQKNTFFKSLVKIIVKMFE